ncbi:MAG: hypothetical protein MIO88_02270 [Methanoregulaceae archaeon]|nr:hypothetical protein [Methanoregulaceae archaeon]
MRNPSPPLFCALLLVAAIVLTGCVAYLPWLSPPVIYPRIVPDKGEFPDLVSTHTFLFGDGQVTITVPVDQSVYRGAQEAGKTVTIYDRDLPDAEWKAGLYRAMIDDPAQEPFYTALLSALRTVKTEQNLDSDRYLELIAIVVQSIPYITVKENDPKYPIETFVDGVGDCDDKSMLLAGLLAREGYAVSLLYFEPENHMAVGVACPGEPYRDTGYAFLESTNITFVGVSGAPLDGNVTLESVPLVIPIGNGTTEYRRCDETRALWEEVERIRARTDLLKEELKPREAELERIRTDLDDLEAAMDHLKALGQVREYNRMVSVYNDKARAYNSLLAEYRPISAEYAMLADRHNYIITHQYDRQGTYRVIFRSGGVVTPR